MTIMSPQEDRPSMGRTGFWPGFLTALSIAAGAVLLRQVSEQALLSPMLVSIVAGVTMRVAMGPNSLTGAGLAFASRPVLRAGIVLLGLQVTLGEIAALGGAAFAVAALTVLATFVAVGLAGQMLGVSRPLTQLIAAGTAVCGASAVVAANSVARGSDAEVGYAVASVTLFGTLAMLALPLMAGPLGLGPTAYGIWSGSSIHEVAQVSAAAFQLGPEAGQVGTITKLIRVMMLAPLVLAMAVIARGRPVVGSATGGVQFPWFVVGFVAFAAINGAVGLPESGHALASLGATLLMSAGLAAMGLSLNLQELRNQGVAPLALSAFGFAFVTIFSLGAVLVSL
jgi:uncharacterized integral membrane protein (TIGR00698 family)